MILIEKWLFRKFSPKTGNNLKQSEGMLIKGAVWEMQVMYL